MLSDSEQEPLGGWCGHCKCYLAQDRDKWQADIFTVNVDTCALLGIYVANSGNSLPMFRFILSVQSYIVKKFFYFLTLGNWADVLFRNSGKELPL